MSENGEQGTRTVMTCLLETLTVETEVKSKSSLIESTGH